MSAAQDALSVLGARPAYQFLVANGVRGERVDPAGGRYSVLYDRFKRPFRFTDEIGRVVGETYDGRGRATAYAYPEGDQEQYAYDDRNDVTSLTKVPTTGSGLANIVIGATWNKLASITDARGNTTSFTYVASGNGAGEMLSATRPADVDGHQPVYGFTYGAFGKLATSTDPTGVVTQNTYDAVNGNLLSTAVDPRHFNSVTSFAYDGIGQVVATTDPRGNVANTTYDADGRKVFEIGPDPDGAGPLLRPATRQVYDAVGRVIEADKGRTTTATGSDFAILEPATTAYDAVGNKVKLTTPAGVTQISYDPANRQLCSATRMYPAVYGALPADACALSTQGANGPDRIGISGLRPGSP